MSLGEGGDSGQSSEGSHKTGITVSIYRVTKFDVKTQRFILLFTQIDFIYNVNSATKSCTADTDSNTNALYST